MKTLWFFIVTLELFSLNHYVRSQYTAIECPFPEGTTSTPTEARCNDFAACDWTDTKCHMSASDKATYLLNGTSEMINGVTEYYFTKPEQYSTLFGSDVKDLTLQIIPHEDYHVQIKIMDRYNERYEVPISVNLPSTEGDSPMYKVNILDPFMFEVMRGDDESPILSTVGPLTYEDQFIQITFKLSSEYMYGLGENSHLTFQHPFDTRTTFPIWPRPQGYTEEPVNLMGQHPYFMVIDDVALGSAHSVLFLNSNPMESSTFLLDDGEPALTLRATGGIMDIHIFMGPHPEDLNKQFVQMIGLPAMPPYYFLGFQLSRYGYNGTDYVRAVVQRNRDAGVPQDIQTCDINYMDNYRIFTYDQVNWGDLPDLATELHEDNLYLTLILDPPLAIDWDNYPAAQRGKDNDVYIKWSSPLLVPSDQEPSCDDYMVGYMWPNNKTVYPDFLNPKTRDWWTSEVEIFHQQIDFDTLWIDMNEPANFGTNMDRPTNYPTTLPDWSLKCPDNKWDNPQYPTMTVRINDNLSDRISDGTLCMSALQSDGNKDYLHYDVHALYALNHAQASSQALKTVFSGKRSMVMSRGTYLGHGQYGCHWLGDNHSTWNHMRLSIIGILEFNMFGIPIVGADICGHFDEPSPELCARWTQLGAFYSLSRNHNNEGNRDQDPASWDEDITEIHREALLKRYTLLPYLYTLLYRASTEGSSVLRPLLNVFSGDVNVLPIDDQFMWGTGLMIAPVVTEGAITREVYFPQGRWYDYRNGEEVSNTAQILTVLAPLEVIPLYLHGGNILPTQEPATRTDISRLNPMALLVALDDSFSAAGELFWDDGVNQDLSADDAQLSSIAFADNTLTYNIESGSASSQSLAFNQVIIYGYSEGVPTSVSVNGETLDISEWVLDDTLNSLTVNVSVPISENFAVDIVCCE